MADASNDKRIVVLCVDQSPQAEWAFECKYDTSGLAQCMYMYVYTLLNLSKMKK